MQFGNKAVVSGLLGVTSVAAGPITTSPVDYTPTGNFYLKTQGITGGGSQFQNLYLTPYHTGAGWNDVALLPGASVAAYLNGTNVQFDLPVKQRSTYSLIMPLQITGAMQSVQINADFKPPVLERQQFFFNEAGLQWTPPDNGTFGGWLACSGTRNVPQLFWQATFQSNLDKGCADVHVYPVSV